VITRRNGLTGAVIGEVGAAVAFLTRVPVRASHGASSGAGAFGLVGVALGQAAAVPVLAIGPTSALVAGVLALAVLAVATGALHLDGLADTADALAAADAAAADRARKDPRIGAGGATALVLVLLVEAGAISEIAHRAGATLAAASVIVACGLSRSVPAAVAVVGRRWLAPGSGQWFGQRVSMRSALVSILTVGIVAALTALATARRRVAASLIVGAGWAVAASAGLARARGGLDGDGLGAITETTFAAALVGALLGT
jgi:adenosylcobinamide-GDP ribazoletransferase